MKLKIITYSINKGGAAKAASNLYKIIKDNIHDSEIISVSGKYSNNIFTSAPMISTYIHFIKMVIARSITFFFKKNEVPKYSLNIFSSSYVSKEINKNSGDDLQIINLHWFNNETISLWELKKIISLPNNKVLITLHDEWFFNSTEHYARQNSLSYIHGYDDDNLVNKIIFNIKKKINLKDVIFTVPSTWLYDRAINSLILKNKKIFLLPNVIDTAIFKKNPDTKLILNKKFNIDNEYNPFIIGFGAISGDANPLKGFDLLLDALKIINKKRLDNRKIILITFGSDSINESVTSLGYHIINLGILKNSYEVAQAYNMLDIMIVPSRVESFGQVAAESLACQTPVVAFNYSGIKDIVIHKKNGYLATPFSSESISDGIVYFLNAKDDLLLKYGEHGRQHVISNFGEDVISEKYMQIVNFIKDKKNEK
ncbi:TPA: glycosyltransferase [Morganella morganii]|nr:glycosyltransferase [Morganella morganii]